MSVPNRIFDGDLTVATQDGPGWFVHPFQDVGDTQSWEWHANYTQLASSFLPFQNNKIAWPGFVPNVELMQSINTVKGIGYLVHEDEPTEIGGTALLRFKRIYAGKPYTRYEGCEVNYAFMIPANAASYSWTSPPPQPEVAEFPMTLPGYRKYEYFISSYPAVIAAPRVSALFYTYVYYPFYSVTPDDGGFPPTYTVPWVAKDSVIKIYKGAFVERMTVYVNGALPVTH